nr:DUF6304 family protein [Paraflavitalea speifideiaquila]
MKLIIPTTYTDKTGSVNTTIENDGENLTLTIDNTRFVSKWFNDFVIENSDNKPSRFSLNRFNELTDCSLLCRIPLILLKTERIWKRRSPWK